MNSNDFSKGDVLKATKRKKDEGYHYIIYYERNSNEDFIGCMITHSISPQNEEMSDTHFESLDEKGNKYSVGYDETLLVKGKFYKLENWGPFTKVGALTATGISFVEKVVENLPLEPFADYCDRNQHNLSPSVFPTQKY